MLKRAASFPIRRMITRPELEFSWKVFKDDEVQFVPKSTASAKIYLRDEQYPTVVKIFED
jgi:hypothetical protein